MKNKKDKEPPIGLVPKNIYDRNVNIMRFNEICGAISRYYNAGLPVPIEWVEEYNCLIKTIDCYLKS